MEDGSSGDFLKSVYRLPIVQTEVCRCLLVNEETNGNYLFANDLNGLNGLACLWFSNDRTLTLEGRVCSQNRFAVIK
jgi:hypothetical protein